MTAARKIGWAHLIFAGAVVVAMLSWAVYAVLWTIPNDQSAIVSAALQHEGNFATILAFNITAGSEARFTVFFQTNVPASIAPSSYRSGEDYAFGPVVWTAPSATFSQFELRYAVFTLEYTLHSLVGFTQSPTIWYSGPQGNLTTADFQSQLVGSYSASIVEVSSPGNYTLHFLNHLSTNATGRMTIGGSSVTYSRPYLYDGLITIGLAGAFSVTTSYVSWKKSPAAKASPKNAQDP